MQTEIQDPRSYDWTAIKRTWKQSWRKHPNFDNDNRVFIEKSPHDVGRVHILEQEFPGTWFICQVRNPYIVAEGVKRRKGCEIRRAAKHSIAMLNMQKQNVTHAQNVLAWRYEDLLPKSHIIEEMVRTIPNLEDFSLQKSVPSNSIDGYLDRRIINLNNRQMASLNDKDIKIMNEEFDPYNNTLLFFGYERINHAS